MTPLGWLGRKTSTQTNHYIVSGSRGNKSGFRLVSREEQLYNTVPYNECTVEVEMHNDNIRNG